MMPMDAPGHANPYPWYASLRQQGDLIYHRPSRCWTGTTAHAVTMLLTHSQSRVRPLDQPTPPPLGQGPAAILFSLLMRMNEGLDHRCPRQALAPSLQDCSALEISRETRRVCTAVLEADGHLELDRAMFHVPVAVVARLLGVRPNLGHRLPTLTADLAAGMAMEADGPAIQRAHLAAQELMWIFTQQLSTQQEPEPLIRPDTNREAGSRIATPKMAANLAGLLLQSHEATAGLVGNTLVTLAQRPALLKRVRQGHVALGEVVDEVARFDAPIQLTRRFIAEECELLGNRLRSGDTVILLLASANRDSEANEDGERFILGRTERRCFSFGIGPHQCPGESVATIIATTTAQLLLQFGRIQPEQLQWHYQASPNARIPLFRQSHRLVSARQAHQAPVTPSHTSQEAP
ncbi:cytochrome P450 [Halomonas huangheensis]|uniref:Cytochrome P450 n=1 Tax=Halomonas huangheensis TaxID=1178482 RepID=W1N8S1_9GAMM|nr:cytochrome P450 [Halomonas huangheensis]ALM54149.1 hypothetical protein AR456_19120 [Halomonas huangheensis]ERL51305.1 hypothetical protein BJB45_21605 [Halomonas huangheensis]